MPGPDIWGPHGWKFIHYITLGYPNNPTEQDKKKYYNFFIELANVVPCSISANHFKQHLQITPLDDKALKDKDSLMAWAIKMHNHVNARNGKKMHSIKDAIKAIIENDDKCIVFKEDNKILYKTSEISETSETFKNIKTEKFNNNNSNINTLILSISIIINILLILYFLFRFKN
jgi:hypothetical protein